MKKWIFIGCCIAFWTKGSANDMADTLILDGYAVELEKDTVPFLDPAAVDLFSRDFKKLPPTIIWYQALGGAWMMTPHQFNLGEGRTALMSIDRNSRHENMYWGLVTQTTVMLNNNIGLSLGVQYGGWRVAAWSATPPVLNDGTVPYKLGYANDQLEVIVKKEVGEDLWELDTLQVGVSPVNMEYRNFQIPLMLQYQRESRSDLWRLQAGIGFVLNQWRASSFQYTYTKDRFLYVDQAPALNSWTYKPAFNMELQRMLSAKNSVYVRCMGQWPTTAVEQGNWMLHAPSFWLSTGWVWKFNNNPYIRAR
jgi:hypothetical protein